MSSTRLFNDSIFTDALNTITDSVKIVINREKKHSLQSTFLVDIKKARFKTIYINKIIFEKLMIIKSEQIAKVILLINLTLNPILFETGRERRKKYTSK